MRSDRDRIIAALYACDTSYRELASLPLEVLSRAEKQELLKRLEEFGKKMTALDRRLIGRLITEADPAQFGCSSWADLLSQRLRISPGEAQRRIAEARSA